MKKRIIWFAIISLLFFITIELIIPYSFLKKTFIHLWFYETSKWAYTADYENYEADFIKVRDYLSENYLNENKKIIRVGKNEEMGLYLWDIDAHDYVSAPDDVLMSVKTIDEEAFSYKYSTFDYIEINGKQVSFFIESNRYALVYSPNGKPKWDDLTDKTVKIKMRRIGGGWYHVIFDD